MGRYGSSTICVFHPIPGLILAGMSICDYRALVTYDRGFTILAF